MTQNEIDMGFTWEQVEAFWSHIAEIEYEDANDRFKASHCQRFHISIPHLYMFQGCTILNMWSRQGEAIPYIREACQGVSIENVEVSKIMLRQARERFPGEKFHWFNMSSIPFPDSSFDAILSLEMLEHTPRPFELLKEAYRVVRPGGRLVITCPPSPIGEIYLFVLDRLFNNHGEGPHKFLSTFTVKNLLLQCGFKVELHKGTMFLPLINGAFIQINRLLERMCQWYPIIELGDRQLYVAVKEPE